MCFNYQISEKTSPGLSLSKPYLAAGDVTGDELFARAFTDDLVGQIRSN